MATTRNDTKGYLRGGRGIDGNDGSDYGTSNQDKAAIQAMYGRSWYGQGGLQDVATTRDGGKGRGGGASDGALQRSAKGK